MCCCGCSKRLVAKPRCHHQGGKGVCGPYALPGANVLDRIVADVERSRLEDEQGSTYVCLAFASDGIAQTDWEEHGCCELWSKNSGVPGATG